MINGTCAECGAEGDCFTTMPEGPARGATLCHSHFLEYMLKTTASEE